MLLEHSASKIVEIAKALNVSTRTVGQIKKTLRNNEDLVAKRAEKCEGKRKTTPRLDKQMIKMCLCSRRSLCRKIPSGLAAQGFVVHRRTVNRRLCAGGLKAYRPR